MDCKEVKARLSEFIDEALAEVDQKKLEEHLRNCPHCKEELSSLQTVISLLQDSEEVSPPKEFRADLRKRLEVIALENEAILEEVPNNIDLPVVIGWGTRLRNTLTKPWAVAAVLLLLVLSFPVIQQSKVATLQDTALEKSQEQKMQFGTAAKGKATGSQVKIAMESDSSMSMTSQDGTSQTMDTASQEATRNMAKEESVTERKIVREGYLHLQVKSVKTISEEINRAVEAVGGFVQTSSFNESNQGFASLVVRIPVKEFQSFFTKLEKMGKLQAKEITGQDVTMQYLDTEARLKSLKVQEERLLTLLEKGKVLEEILKIETELQRVREEIERQESQLKALKDLAELATLTVELSQDSLAPAVSSSLETPGLAGVFKRSLNALIESSNSLINFLGLAIVFVGGAIPYLILLGVVYLIYYWAKGRYFNKGR